MLMYNGSLLMFVAGLMSVAGQNVLEHQPYRVLSHCQRFSLVLPTRHNLGKRGHPYGKAPLFLRLENHCEVPSLHGIAPWCVLTKLYLFCRSRQPCAATLFMAAEPR